MPHLHSLPESDYLLDQRGGRKPRPFQDAKRAIPILLRPLFFISGIFFPATAVPAHFKSFIMWNPVLHALELMREAMFSDYTSHEGSWSYLFICSSLSLLTGLTVYRYFRIKVLTSGSID